jgi:hypothetical protein
LENRVLRLGGRKMELHERKELIARAKYLMDHHGYDAFTAIKIAEQNIEEQKKMGEENE